MSEFQIEEGRVAELDCSERLHAIMELHTFVLIDFYATWCAPCLQMLPMIERIASENKEVLVIKVEVDEHLDLVGKYKIMGVPTLSFFKQGEEVWRKIGVASYDQIDRGLSEYIDSRKKDTGPGPLSGCDSSPDTE